MQKLMEEKEKNRPLAEELKKLQTDYQKTQQALDTAQSEIDRLRIVSNHAQCQQDLQVVQDQVNQKDTRPKLTTFKDRVPQLEEKMADGKEGVPYFNDKHHEHSHQITQLSKDLQNPNNQIGELEDTITTMQKPTRPLHRSGTLSNKT
ncbi:hypothetical protein LTS18_008418 [Coniosporium uncinatum]|uniref:Uncharacterized protein n=1 Tax=Coniosporium uncinatum TaxID=93489 RepID=A0ACC3DWV2_9PEZI|nr:hypothetical protein LTS18_008418 [Coniosporium uncinatum]